MLLFTEFSGDIGGVDSAAAALGECMSGGLETEVVVVWWLWSEEGEGEQGSRLIRG